MQTAYEKGVAAAEAFLSRQDSSSFLLGSAGTFVRRLDFRGGQPKCDRRYGWKKGGKGCERAKPQENPEKNYGTDHFLTPIDRDLIEYTGGSAGIDAYQKGQGVSREKAVEYSKNAGRLIAQDAVGQGNFNEEISELNDFMKKGKKNKYGTKTYVSRAEARWIDRMGGPESVAGLPKDKAVNYLRDIYATSPTFLSEKDSNEKALPQINKHYFGK